MQRLFYLAGFHASISGELHLMMDSINEQHHPGTHQQDNRSCPWIVAYALAFPPHMCPSAMIELAGRILHRRLHGTS